ncbi:MAG: hypothetical protein E7514_03045 [Ruminococcaceae bacterium]|nr:hypothetical protein [Oscillospiraceae bacterium]
MFKKRFTAAVLTAAFMFIMIAALPAHALDESDAVISNDGLWKYTVLSDGTAALTGGNWKTSSYLGNETELTVPAEIDGIPVSTVGPFTFYNRSDITQITVPEGISILEIGAFYNCSALEKIVLPDSLSKIGDNAFYNCAKLDFIKLPDGLDEIGETAFDGCSSLDGIVLPDSLRILGSLAFYNCTSLQSLVFPAGVYDVNADLVMGCTSLKDVTVFYNPYCTYTGIGSIATEIIIPDGVVKINEGTLKSCVKITEITIGKDVEIIPEDSFDGCDNLHTIYGFTGSYAEIFAENHGYEFIPIGVAYAPLPDVPDNVWYRDAVGYCVRHGFMNGYGNGRFGPANKLQRQDFILILANIDGVNSASYTNCRFPDVDINSYYGRAVAWALQEGIINGYEDGRFGVGDPITREQVCAILYRYLTYIDKETALHGTPNFVLRKFDDRGNVSNFAEVSVAWCVQNKIIAGKNKFTLAPKDNALRCEIAQIITNMDRLGYFEK